MRLSNIKECGKCKSSIMYGDTLKCNSLNYDCRNKFKEEGGYYACKCPEYREGKQQRAGIIKQGKELRFILAGKSEFILHSTKTGEDFRFKLIKQISKDDDTKCIYFLNKVLANESIYAGIIIYNEDTGLYDFKQGKNGNVSSLDIGIRSLVFVINKLNKGEAVGNLEVYHVGKCGCCESKLVTVGDESTGLCKICDKQLEV